MDHLLHRVLPYFSDHTMLLLGLFLFTFFMPRTASYFWAALTGLLVAYGLLYFWDDNWRALHHFLTSWNLIPAEVLRDVPEGARDAVERAFSWGVYWVLVVAIFIILVVVPKFAVDYVREAIYNIGRRPAQEPPPRL